MKKISFHFVFLMSCFLMQVCAEEAPTKNKIALPAADSNDYVKAEPSVNLGSESAQGAVVPAQVKASGGDLILDNSKWVYPPVIYISKWGREFRIVVEPSILMDEEKAAAIQSVRLETETGQFLGLKTFGLQEVKRRAEFMLDPQALKVDKVKVIVSSALEGTWTETPLLAVTDEESKAAKTQEFGDAVAEVKETPKEVETVAVDAQPEPAPKTKKRGWFW